MSIGADPAPGLRALRRARLASEIETVALGMFASRGFSAVTVDEISVAAGISNRTFFRYFPIKEDVVLGGVVQRIERVVPALAGRPAGEPVVTAIRHALSEVTDAESFRGSRIERWRASVMIGEPAIAERGLRRLLGIHGAMTAVVADRMGVDPSDDLRPGVITAAMVGALTAGWHAGVASGRVDRLPVLAAEALDLLVPALAPLAAPRRGGGQR